MKTSIRAALIALATFRLAHGSQATASQDIGLLTVLFLVFCVAVVICQVLPAGALCITMMREFFSAVWHEKVHPSGKSVGGR